MRKYCTIMSGCGICIPLKYGLFAKICLCRGIKSPEIIKLKHFRFLDYKNRILLGNLFTKTEFKRIWRDDDLTIKP